jgi:hypothetical protein
MGPRTSIVRLAVWVWFCVALAAPAWAALGQRVTSVEADRRQMRGTVRVEQRQAYAMHEIRAASGVVVREYVSPAGWVFAVAWQGRVMPDLVQLLGASYPAYRKALAAAPRRRGPLVLRSGGLVVQLGGRMRAHSGRAWLTDLLPANVSAEVIR